MVKDTLTGSRWVNINPHTPGFEALLNSSGYKGYMDASAASLEGDVNYLINEDDQRALHGERQAHAVSQNGYSVPVGVVNGLKMGTADQRYQKTQSVTLYQRDAAGVIQYKKNADDTFVLDPSGNKIPLTVTSSLVLDRNSDVYLKPCLLYTSPSPRDRG